MGSNVAARTPYLFLVPSKRHIAHRLIAIDCMLHAAVSESLWVRFEVDGILQAIPPVEPVPPHYRDDAASPSRQSLRASRSCGDTGDVYGKSCLVYRVPGRQRAVESRIIDSAAPTQ
ncbi:MAG TPA: hypothetical protein VLU47_07650 [Blastocatellia bacterium]|nr:hypothetical protein [Blastocatellia bacterium]